MARSTHMDAVRGVLAAWLVAFHAGDTTSVWWARNGWLAVDVYHAATGYLVVAGGWRPGSTVRGLRRLLPLLAAAAASAWLSSGVTPIGLVLSPLWVGIADPPLHTTVWWSLSTIVAGWWMLDLLSVMPESRRTWALVGVVCACAGLRAGAHLSDLPGLAYTTRLDGVALGAIVASSGYRWRWAPLAWGALALAPLPDAYAPAWSLGGYTAGAVVASLAVASIAERAAWSGLAARWASWMGAISAPLYLLHPHVIERGYAGLGWGLGTTLVASVAIAAAWVAVSRLELPGPVAVVMARPS